MPADFLQIGNAIVLIVVELPQARERAKRHVELPARPIAYLTGRMQRLADVRAHRHRLLARSRVQPLDVAALPPDAHQTVQSLEVAERRLECGQGGGLVGCPRRDAEFRAHREPRSLDDVSARRGGSRLGARERREDRRRDAEPDKPDRTPGVASRKFVVALEAPMRPSRKARATENTGSILTDEQRRGTGCIGGRMHNELPRRDTSAHGDNRTGISPGRNHGVPDSHDWT